MSDDWIINGSWHVCECGADWSDSDGGPCHWRCATCDTLTDSEELTDNTCDECADAQAMAHERAMSQAKEDDVC